MDRPDWDSYFLAIAGTVSLRADCTRRQVGAVIVKDHRIVSTGYNGAPAGNAGCLGGACPRGKHYLKPVFSYPDEFDFCACGEAWPCPKASEPGSNYSNCVAIHAEANALLYARWQDCQGSTIYITDEPCSDCSKLITGAGIKVLVWPGKTHREIKVNLNDTEARAA